MSVREELRALVSLAAFPLLALALLVRLPTPAPTPAVQPAAAAAFGAAAGLLLFALRAARGCRGSGSARPRGQVGAIAVAAVVGASEEVIWRGFALARLAPAVGVAAALAVTSTGFALSHYPAFGRRGATVHLGSGLVFGGIFVASGSTAACATAHALYNVLALATRGSAQPAVVAAGAPAVALREVHKRFGQTVALAGLNLTIRAGEVVAVLGPNGAGKSTAVSIVLGLRRADAGSAEVFGLRPRSARSLVGATPQEMSFPPTLRTREIVDFVRAHYRDAPPTAELLRRFGLEAVAARQTGGLSGGQRRRLAIALAFAGASDLAVLDEPTTGLDVEARRSVWAAVREYAHSGGTVLLTTHSLEEAEALADRVVVVARGRAVADGTVEELKARAGRSTLEDAFLELTREQP